MTHFKSGNSSVPISTYWYRNTRFIVMICLELQFLPMNTQDWCWSWNANTLATWCEELTHLQRPWCWEKLKAGGEGDDREWDGWMASLTQWTWVWVNSGSWWWTGRPGVLQSIGSQRVGHDWVTELNWWSPVASPRLNKWTKAWGATRTATGLCRQKTARETGATK